MNVWLVRDLDPLPIDGEDRRLMRSGLLANALARRGHKVHWITSSFDHYRKRNRADAVGNHTLESGVALHVLAGQGYPSNVSIARIRHNRGFASRFKRLANNLERPDVIAVDLPTTEAAQAAVHFARNHAIPSVLSIRDLWPDFFLDYLPMGLRPLARPALFPLERQARSATRHASALIGVSENYLAWGQHKGARRQTGLDAVFPLGYRPTVLPDAERRQAVLAQHAIAQDRAIAAFVGSWGRTYDLELLAQTAQILEGSAEVQFVIAGDPEDRPELARKLARLSNVTLTGWLGAEAIAVLLDTAAIGLLPYAAKAPQGLPNKLFEYMAYGPYQVSTLQGEAGDVLAASAAGTAVKPSSATAMADAIVKYRDRGIDPLARAARIAHFRENFDSELIYERLVDHIELVLREAPR